VKPKPDPISPGQESVWDYPRPPRIERTSKRLRVVFNGEVIADTVRGYRVLETSHPPVYYVPSEDVAMHLLESVPNSSLCEFKGAAQYFDVKVGERRAERCAWCYPRPTADFEPVRDYLAFYAEPMDECTVDGERVKPQAGRFYGGWITSDVVGPFKGEPGSLGW